MIDFSLPAAHGRPRVMGVLNITPDSFSDGGTLYVEGSLNLDEVLRRADNMLAEEVDIFDVGGESTRPGAKPLAEQEELERVMPAVEALASRFNVPISIDTSSPVVMSQAVAAGAMMVNDVRALSQSGALETMSQSGAAVCLMHLQSRPETMQQAPVYQDVAVEVQAFLQDRVRACVEAGIEKHRLLIDPGFGFGKNLAHNIALLQALPQLVAEGYPVLVGLSRKRMVGEITGRQVDERVHGSVALALLAAQRGAAMIRVHDVGATIDVLKIWAAIEPE